MDIHWAPQSFLLNPNSINYDFIGRFENFSEDAKTVFDMLNLEAPDELFNFGKWHSTSASDNFNKYYGPEEKKLVEQIYAEDFLAFGYELDSQA